jgi:hypothetical protein
MLLKIGLWWLCEKNHPKCCPIHTSCYNSNITFSVKKVVCTFKIGLLRNFLKSTQSKTIS